MYEIINEICVSSFSLEKVTSADIQRVAQRLLNSVPSVAARGDIQNLPELKDITNALNNNGRSLGRRLSLFK